MAWTSARSSVRIPFSGAGSVARSRIPTGDSSTHVRGAAAPGGLTYDTERRPDAESQETEVDRSAVLPTARGRGGWISRSAGAC